MNLSQKQHAGLITTVLLIAVGIGLLVYFQIDVRALIGVALRWLGAILDSIK